MCMYFSSTCCSMQLSVIPELKSHFQGVSGLQQTFTQATAQLSLTFLVPYYFKLGVLKQSPSHAPILSYNPFLITP